MLKAHTKHIWLGCRIGLRVFLGDSKTRFLQKLIFLQNYLAMAQHRVFSTIWKKIIQHPACYSWTNKFAYKGQIHIYFQLMYRKILISSRFFTNHYENDLTGSNWNYIKMWQSEIHPLYRCFNWIWYLSRRITHCLHEE